MPKKKYQIILCIGLGLLGSLSFAPVSIPFFFIIGFAYLAYTLKNTHLWKDVFLYSWLYAVSLHLGGLYWISASLFVDIDRYLFVLPFSLLALPIYLAFLFAGGAMAAHFFRKNAFLHAWALASFIFVSEILRGLLFTGFPWNLFGYIWTDHLEISQSVSLFGIEGLTYLTLLCSASLSLIFNKTGRGQWVFIASVWGIFSLLALWGHERLSQETITFHENVNVRLVQPATEQKQRRTLEQRIMAFENTIALSKTASEKPITHIIWPETASPFFLNIQDEARNQLKTIIPKNGALITGTPLRNGSNYYNSLVILDETASLQGRYDKARLVPFGEFIPFRNILKVIPVATDMVGGGADFSRGNGPKTLAARNLPPFSPLICYEIIFSGHMLEKTDTNIPQPQWLLQITNDAWFGDTSGPYQHLAMARIRAIEEGLPLLRVANSGISAVIDPYGQIISSLPLNTRGVLDAQLPKPLKQNTFFKTYGGFISYLLAFFSIAICFCLRYVYRHN